MSYVNADWEKNKVVTLRLTETEYQDLSKYVDSAAKKSYWPRKTISSCAGEMIRYCLKNNIDVFKR